MLKALGFAAAIALSLTGAAGAEPIRLGMQPWLGYGPLWVAEEKGFFDKHGVDVELTSFDWDQDITAALSTGEVEVAAAATNSVIANSSRGLDQKGFLIMDLSFEADAIIAGKDIAAIADLKGKRVAFESGSTSDLLLNYALRSNGMDIDDIVAVPMAASEAGFALVAGRVDAAVTYEPYISAALDRSEDDQVLYTAAEKPGLISDLLTAKAEWIESNLETVKGLLLAWDDAVRFIRENPQQGGAMIAQAIGSTMEDFTPAFEGVRLYDLDEMIVFLDTGFADTVTEIGAILQATKPDEIKAVPSAGDILDMRPLFDLKNQ